MQQKDDIDDLEARLAGAELRAHEAKQARKTKSRRMSERMSESELELERSPNPVPAARPMLQPRPATARLPRDGGLCITHPLPLLLDVYRLYVWG